MSNTLEGSLRSVLAPDPHRDPVDFLEYNIKSIPYSPQAGPFRISNSPWLSEPLKALVDPEVKQIGILGNVQSGKSWEIEAATCLLPILAPGPTLILQDIDDNATDFLETRLRLLWESVPAVRDVIGVNGIPKKGAIQFRNNTAWVLGANNWKRNLQRRSIRYVLGDEVWNWPRGALKEALARTTAYNWQCKVVLVSQGGTDQDDWSNWMNSTDMRVWTFACTECGHRQAWTWEQVKFPKEAKTVSGWNLDMVKDNTTYECEACKHKYKDSNLTRSELNKTGEYVVTNPNAPAGRRGYMYNALAMQWGLSWGDLAVECIEAKRAFTERADNTSRKEFIQKRLAKTFKEIADEINLSTSSGDYLLEDEWPEEGGFIKGKVTAGKLITPEQRLAPDFVRLRFLTVDVQRRGFWWLIRSWDGAGSSRLFQCGYCFSWQEVLDIQKKYNIHPANVAVDSGDNQDEVLNMCATHGWNASRGDARNDFAWRVKTQVGIKTEHRPYSVPVIENVGSKRCKRTYFSNLRFKDTLSLLIRQGRHTRPSNTPEAYIQQMQSERRIISGSGKPIWEQIASRDNHLWDAEVMQLIFATHYKLTSQATNKISENKDV